MRHLFSEYQRAFLSIQAQDFIEERNMTQSALADEIFLSIQAQDFIEEECGASLRV